MSDEREIREKVRALRQFYTNLMIYGAVSVMCFLIWAMTGGYFWPIWVILGFVGSSILQGIKLGMFPVLEDIFPFLKPDWEEEQVKTLLNDQENQEKKSVKKKKTEDKNK